MRRNLPLHVLRLVNLLGLTAIEVGHRVDVDEAEEPVLAVDALEGHVTYDVDLIEKECHLATRCRQTLEATVKDLIELAVLARRVLRARCVRAHEGSIRRTLSESKGGRGQAQARAAVPGCVAAGRTCSLPHSVGMGKLDEAAEVHVLIRAGVAAVDVGAPLEHGDVPHAPAELALAIRANLGVAEHAQLILEEQAKVPSLGVVEAVDHELLKKVARLLVRLHLDLGRGCDGGKLLSTVLSARDLRSDAEWENALSECKDGFARQQWEAAAAMMQGDAWRTLRARDRPVFTLRPMVCSTSAVVCRSCCSARNEAETRCSCSSAVRAASSSKRRFCESASAASTRSSPERSEL